MANDFSLLTLFVSFTAVRYLWTRLRAADDEKARTIPVVLTDAQRVRLAESREERSQAIFETVLDTIGGGVKVVVWLISVFAIIFAVRWMWEKAGELLH
jgi:hypothetical protein